MDGDQAKEFGSLSIRIYYASSSPWLVGFHVVCGGGGRWILRKLLIWEMGWLHKNWYSYLTVLVRIRTVRNGTTRRYVVAFEKSVSEKSLVAYYFKL